MCCSICLNSRWNITISRIGVLATTVVIRRFVSSSPISPKKSRRPSTAMGSPS
jgi:hypothetical protein